MHIIACASGNSIVLQRGMHIYAKCRTKLTQQLSSSFLRDADGLTVYCKARDNYGVWTGETLNFTCEMSNRVRLLLHLHLDTFFRRDLYNRGSFRLGIRREWVVVLAINAISTANYMKNASIIRRKRYFTENITAISLS